jgi:hypothetical protein
MAWYNCLMRRNIGNPSAPSSDLNPRLEDARLRPNRPGVDLRHNLEQQAVNVERSNTSAVENAAQASTDEFIRSRAAEVGSAPEILMQRSGIMQNVINAGTQTRNAVSFRHMPISKLESETSQSSEAARKFLSAANASAITKKEKPSVSTSTAYSLSRHAYLGEIASTADRLMIELNNAGRTRFPSNHPLRLSLKDISGKAKQELNEASFIVSVKKSLSSVDAFLLENKDSNTSIDRSIVDHYIKGLFLANNGKICARIAVSSEMRASLARVYGNPMIHWKYWVGDEKAENASKDWEGATAAASAVKLIINKTDHRTINLEKYINGPIRTSDNLDFLSDFEIHEITAGQSGRFLIAESVRNKNTSKGMLKIGDCIIVGAPEGSHVEKTSGKYNTTYANLVARTMINEFK